MYRLLSAVFVALFALALAAAPAQADRGGKWRGWRDHQGDNRGPPPGGDRPHDNGAPPGDFHQNNNNYPPSNTGNDDRGHDFGGPWFCHREHDRAREGMIRGRMMPLEDLENRIGRSAPGFRIGNPELLMFGGRPVYRIRWRTPDGHILIVFADAETGQVLDIRGR